MLLNSQISHLFFIFLILFIYFKILNFLFSSLIPLKKIFLTYFQNKIGFFFKKMKINIKFSEIC